MKRLFIPLTLLALFLTACGAAATEQPASVQEATAVAQIVSTQLAQQAVSAPTKASASTFALNSNYTDAVSVGEQLLTGTFMLADTSLSLTGEQKTQLITLWTSLKDATQNSATQEQTDAIVQQIEQVMTPEQIQAIADFKITRQSMMSVLQDKGVMMSGPQGNGRPNGAGGDTPPDGTPSAGGPGDGNGTPPQMDGTPQAGNPPQGRGKLLPAELIDALIQFLQGTQG